MQENCLKEAEKYRWENVIRRWERLIKELWREKMYAKKEGRKMDEVVEYQRRVMEKIKTLSLERLRVVLDFIEYLEEKEEWEATLEVLKDEETMENIKAADDAWEARRMGEFMPWEKVRRDVQDTYSQESSKDIQGIRR